MSNSNKLTNSKTFCMMPWVHMHAFADGRVYPCCFGDYHEPMGNLRDNTMAEIWNNPAYQTLRQNMLNNKPSSVCKKCYEQENSGIFSLRNSINQSHGKYVDEIELTANDGTHPEFKLRYWDVRFSNLCNFSCRSCGPVFSSNWYKEHVKMFGRKPEVDGRDLSVVEYAGRSKYDIWEQMQPHIPYLDQIYFAGGEPLIMEEHYMLLEKLIELGKTDINLQYNTNFSEMSYKGKSVVELWKHFSNVSVGASLDASHHRGELMRRGQQWDQVVENRRRMIAEVPHVDFYISATVSAMNVLHVLDFHREWVELGLIQPKDFDVNVLYSPDWYRIDILPENFKRQVVKPAYEKHLSWLSGVDTLTRASNGFCGALNMMMAEDRSNLLPAFRKQIDLLDGARGEDFWATFPELRVLKQNDNLCILPWISLETSPVGTARPCCLAEEEIVDENGLKMSVKQHSLDKIFNSNYMQDLRQQFRQGLKPKTCKKCWAEEAAGRTSKRLNTQVKFKESIKDIPVLQDTVDSIWFLDLKLGNICNLKCRICGSWSSSKWAGEEIDYLKQAGATKAEQKQHTAYQMLKQGAWPRESQQFWDSLDQLLPTVKYLEFTGGEPFLIQEHVDLLKRAADLGYAKNIGLHYNTNGTVYPTELEAIWADFNRVEIALSIDNVGSRFEYERYGADWFEVNNNVRKFESLKSSCANIDLQLCFTVNVLNVLYLADLLDWAKTVKFNNYHWNMLHGPEEMSIASLPDNAKNLIIQQLTQQFANTAFKKDVDNLISMMSNGISMDSKFLIEKLSVTDQYRNQHLSQTHPELAKILNYGN
jgi:radical SAM protein with 4Fe4S-binding SPASM domain